MSKPKIILEDINKEFHTKRQVITALKDINMTFNEKEIVSVVGPSGCGKSTIIRMIDDLIKPTSGKIIVDGYEYDNNKAIPKDLIKKLGFVFQLPNLYPWLTIKENVMLPLKIMGISGAEWNEYADYLLKFVNMSEYADVYPDQISGGMKQRVGVIRAMVHKPEILMMDEPFGALDESTREQMNLEFLKIWEQTNMTVIFITHNVAEAVLMGNRVYVMASYPGRLIEEVSIDLPEKSEEIMNTKEFSSYCLKLTNLIGTVELNKVK